MATVPASRRANTPAPIAPARPVRSAVRKPGSSIARFPGFEAGKNDHPLNRQVTYRILGVHLHCVGWNTSDDTGHEYHRTRIGRSRGGQRRWHSKCGDHSLRRVKSKGVPHRLKRFLRRHQGFDLGPVQNQRLSHARSSPTCGRIYPHPSSSLEVGGMAHTGRFFTRVG